MSENATCSAGHLEAEDTTEAENSKGLERWRQRNLTALLSLVFQIKKLCKSYFTDNLVS